ncbi:hypothetical protein GCM10011611_44470 [Aliidongia dinghuensis]|uniref:Uncharacterized protein n=1 Tax=Aliidongia dinghuensis TaxID=1867774 RepID=A0A8J2YYR4_9PROT|nr:hypothetical protein GCM10011611_44470 [Aliidongia dinghuensis]
MRFATIGRMASLLGGDLGIEASARDNPVLPVGFPPDHMRRVYFLIQSILDV